MIAVLSVTKELLQKKLSENSAILGEAAYLSASTEVVEILPDASGDENRVLVKTKISPKDLLLIGYLNDTSPVQLTEYPVEPDPVPTN